MSSSDFATIRRTLARASRSTREWRLLSIGAATRRVPEQAHAEGADRVALHLQVVRVDDIDTDLSWAGQRVVLDDAATVVDLRTDHVARAGVVSRVLCVEAGEA